MRATNQQQQSSLLLVQHSQLREESKTTIKTITTFQNQRAHHSLSHDVNRSIRPELAKLQVAVASRNVLWKQANSLPGYENDIAELKNAACEAVREYYNGEYQRLNRALPTNSINLQLNQQRQL